MTEGNGDWGSWSKWVVSALKTVIKTGEDLTQEVKGIREDVASRLATLEERCSAETMQTLATKVQNNQITLAKVGAAGVLGGGVAAAIFKLAEAIATQAQSGGMP